MNTFLNSRILNGRKIVIWGAGEWGRNILAILKKYGHQIECFVDSNAQNISNIEGYGVNGIDFLENNRKKYYVVVAVWKWYPEIRESLLEMGYTNTDDYFYINRTAIEPKIENGHYEDDFGNCVDIEKNIHFRLRIVGRNNNVKCENVMCHKNTILTVSNESNVYIENTLFTGGCNMNVSNSNLTINNRANIGKVSVNVNNNSDVKIDSSVLCDTSEISINEGSNCNIEGSYITEKIYVTGYSNIEILQSRIESDIYINNKSKMCSKNSYIEKNNLINIDSNAKFIIDKSYLKQDCIYKILKGSILKLSEVEFEKENRIVCLNDAEININGTTVERENIITCFNEAELFIDKAVIRNQIRIYCENNSVLEMSKTKRIGDFGRITCRYNSQILISQNVEMLDRAFIVAAYGGSITIDEDTGMSSDVSILSDATHPIFDINNPQKYTESAPVEIKRHAWLGKGCKILGGSVIGESSIVSTGAVTANKYPNNCLIMGYPARAVKYDIAFDWEETDPDNIDKKYWKLTED